MVIAPDHALHGRDATAPAYGRRQRRVALALLLAAWLAFTIPAFTGKARFPVDYGGPAPGQTAGPVQNPELGDAYYALYPWYSYLGDRLRDGDLPHWDPYRFAGTPFAANPANGVWYPPNWLYATGHVLAAFTVVALGSMLAALLLTYWFFRMFDLHPYAAALGAIVFVFSAFMLTWSANLPLFGSSMWLPLALGGLELTRRGKLRRGIPLAAAGLALSVLAGHVQMAIYVWLTAGIFVAVGMVASALRTGGPVAGRVRVVVAQAAPVAAAFVLAAGLAAVVLLPTAGFARHIVRQETPFALARLTAMPVENLPSLLVPDYLGNPLDGNFAGPGINFTATALYAGLLTGPLALIALARRRDRLTAALVVVTAVGAAAMLATPLYRAMLALPGLSRGLFVTRFVLLLHFGLAGLAAVGLDSLLVRPRRRTMAVVLAAAGAAALVLVLLLVTRAGTAVDDDYVLARGLRSLVLLAAGTALLMAAVRFPPKAAGLAAAVTAVTVLDLWLAGHRWNAYYTPRPVYARSPGVDALASAPGERPRYVNLGSWWIPPNGELAYRLYGISGYDPFVPRRIVELMSIADDQRSSARGNLFGPFRPETATSPILDLLGVGTVVGSPDLSLEAPLRFAGAFRAYDRPAALPPAWITSCWAILPDTAVLSRLAAMTPGELAATAVVADSTAARRALGPSPTAGCDGGNGGNGQAQIQRYDPERVVVRTEAARAGVVVLSDAWFPGWEAKVDGKPVTLLRTDHALRGVAIPPGRHTIEYSFRPPYLVLGGALSAGSIVVLLVWAGWPRGVSGRRRSAPADPTAPVPLSAEQ